MKIKYTYLAIVFIGSFVFCRITANSEAVVDTKTPVLSKINGTSVGVNETVDSVNKGKVSNLEKNDSSELLESKGVENEQKKANDSALKDGEKDNKGLGTESKKEPMVREKCDSSSNSCTDDDKTLVACLRVPGNESPELSLLVQNKGKGPLSITVSAPDLVKLERNGFELQENEDSEVKVSIKGVENGHFIILTAGHGNCSLDFRGQFVSRKKAEHIHDSSYLNIFNPTYSTGFLFLAALLILVVSILICMKFGRSYFARKDSKYEKLDMELPVSHGSKLESEGWDDSWGDSWDDEEAPSLPLTPSLSSKGMASRKSTKDGWKD